MKVLRVAAVLAFIASSTLLAQAPLPAPGLIPAEGPPMTVAEALRRVASDGSGFAPKVIQLESAYYAYVIPAAGSVQGAGGTYYRSDFAVSNFKNAAQKIGIGWVAQGVDNSTAPLTYFSIPANQAVIQADIVKQSLGKSGLGSLVVFGETSSNSTDTTARLLSFSRIWSNQPNASGTVSLQFPAVAIADSVGSAHAYALGLRHDNQYRTNVGIVNLDDQTHTWTVRIAGLVNSGTFTITVLPFSMMQVPLPSGNYGDLFLDISTTGNGINWSAYGASVDNITGDGWVARAIQP